MSQHLKTAIQEIQQYKGMMAKTEEQKYLYYQGVYQQGYSDVHASGKCWKQYEPLDASQLFALHYYPYTKKMSPSSSIGRDILEIHAPICDL